MNSNPPWLYAVTAAAVTVSDGWESRSLPIERVTPDEIEVLSRPMGRDGCLKASALRRIWHRAGK